MIHLPPIVGSVKKVEHRHYDEIISCYVNKVKQLSGVLSVIGLGSVTIPGLSDIDILVVINSENPPAWEEISLKSITKGMKGSEVILHDVFVVPEEIANYIEGFFYLDRSTVYYGKQIGGKFNAAQIQILKKLITFDYSVHRINTSFALLKTERIDLREIILLISTLRHSYKLLSELDVITQEQAKNGIRRIEVLRKNTVLQKQLKEDIKLNLICGLELLFKSVNLLSYEFGYKGLRSRLWVLDTKKIVIPSNFDDLKSAFRLFLKIPKHIPASIYPPEVYEHVRRYQKILNSVNSGLEPIQCNSLLELMDARAFLVDKHWKFIRRSNYYRSSGQGYIVLTRPEARSMKTIVKSIVFTTASFFINSIRKFSK